MEIQTIYLKIISLAIPLLPDPELAGQRSVLIRKESAFSGKSEESMIPKKGG